MDNKIEEFLRKWDEMIKAAKELEFELEFEVNMSDHNNKLSLQERLELIDIMNKSLYK